MGSSASKLPKDKIDQWINLTFLRQGHILHCYERFRLLNVDEIDKNPCGERVPTNAIIKEFPELKENPFGERLCEVFSTAKDSKGQCEMTFEDFIDMVSVLSEGATIQIKADWAFRVFDHDGDQIIGEEDITWVIKQLIKEGEPLADQEIDEIVLQVIKEANGRGSAHAIQLAQFRQWALSSPDFGPNFTIRF